MKRRREETGARGQITVFLALSLTLVFALLLGLWESARTQAARLYFTQSVNASMDSLFSQYHRELWERYRLLGLEHYAEEQLGDEWERFLTPYLEAADWYPLKPGEPEILEKKLLTDLNGELFEQEVLAYMPYGLLEAVWDERTAETMLTQIREAAALDRVSDLYEGHTRDAVRLEQAIERITEALSEQKEAYEEALSAGRAYEGNRLIRRLRALSETLAVLPGRVADYEKQADRLSEALDASERRYETEKADLSAGVREAMEQEILCYRAYTEEDGQRRAELAAIPQRAEENRRFLDDMIAEAEEIQAYIDAWEPEDEDDELDEAALWEPFLERLQRYDLIAFGGPAGVADPEKEGFLEAVGDLMKGNILELLLPEGVSVSKETLSLPLRPSESCFSGEARALSKLTDRVLMGEYMLKTMDCFLEEDPAESGGQRSGHAELEYVLNGRETDYENLSDTVAGLLALREGLNLIYLFSDGEKRAEARELAFLITGAAGFTPLIAVMSFLILGVWAFGQALCDLRDLLAGKRVLLLHDADSFYLSLSGLLAIGQSGGALSEQGEGERGLSYREYLRILLFWNQSSLYEYRTMDMIQMNVRSRQEDFLLNRCIYALEIGAEADTKHVLASMGMLRNFLPQTDAYRIRTETFYSY